VSVQDQQTPLYWAALLGDSAMVRALLDGKADVDACNTVRMRAGTSGRRCWWVGVAMHWVWDGWGG